MKIKPFHVYWHTDVTIMDAFDGFCLAEFSVLCYSQLIMISLNSIWRVFCMPLLCVVAAPVYAAEIADAERSVDSLISTYEDLSNALAGVQDVTDADLVASRVAVDILLIRELNVSIQQAGELETSPKFAKSFATRSAEVSKTVEAAMARLKDCKCYESDALSAALYLIPLVSPDVRPGPDMAEYATELVVNNCEVIIMLLDEATDAESAAIVADLVASAMGYGEELEDFADELGDAAIPEERKFFFGQRMQNYKLDFEAHRERLKEQKFFNCKALSDLFE